MTTIAALRKLLEEATPGPWSRLHIGGTGDPGSFVLLSFQERDVEIDPHDEADAALIVAAVNALPALLDVADRAEEYIAWTRGEALELDGVSRYERFMDALAALFPASPESSDE